MHDDDNGDDNDDDNDDDNHDDDNDDHRYHHHYHHYICNPLNRLQVQQNGCRHEYRTHLQRMYNCIYRYMNISITS
jgi:hypothetical protein